MSRDDTALRALLADPDTTYTIDEFAELFPAPPEAARPVWAKGVVTTDSDLTMAEVARMLSFIPPTLPYNEYRAIWMGVASVFPGEEGLELIDAWSSEAREENGQYSSPRTQPEKHAGFRGEGITIGSVIHEAKKYGYIPPSPPTPIMLHKKGQQPMTYSRIGTLLSEVTPEEIAWFWRDLIPFGEMTIIDGDPGKGKSLLTMDLAARISTGRPLPGSGESHDPAGVVLVALEDHLAATIRPRLEAAGADLTRILAITEIPEGEGVRVPSLLTDIPIIADAIERMGARLVILDPLMTLLGGIDSYKDQDVRRALTPLGKLAHDTGAAILVVRHLTKRTEGAAIHRGGGSIGIIAAARAAMLVAQHPEDENLRVVAHNKGNLSKTKPSFAYSIDNAENGAACLSWRGPVRYTAEMLLHAPSGDDERGALEEAKEFLRDTLSIDGLSSVVVQRKAREAGVTDATLRRAKKALGVVSKRHGFGNDSHSTWHLPVVAQTPTIRVHARDDEQVWEDAAQNIASGQHKPILAHSSSIMSKYGGQSQSIRENQAAD